MPQPVGAAACSQRIKPTFLNLQLTFLRYQLTFLRYQLTFLSLSPGASREPSPVRHANYPWIATVTQG
jgi:hypothetical protein